MFLLGFASGLYSTGFCIGIYNSFKYSNKIFQESKSQSLPFKFLSIYGATACSLSMGVSTGFTFIGYPILFTIYTFSRPISHKIDEYDIITFTK